MIHIVFDRPTGKLKAPEFGFTFDASGSAWGDGQGSAYGHDCQIAPGHYKLTAIDYMSPPIMAEGAAQIHVEDLTEDDAHELSAAGEITDQPDEQLGIGGIVLPFGSLAKYGRSAIMVHGGGSNLGSPACFALNQPLCRTFGCTRLHNGDLSNLCGKLQPVIGTEHVVFSVVGDSPALSR